MLDGLPAALPALSQADEIQRRAKRVGFDWQTIEPVVAKIHEELQELKEAETDEERQSEAGDVLFAVVNLIRWLDVDPEMALRGPTIALEKICLFGRSAAKQGKHLEG